MPHNAVKFSSYECLYGRPSSCLGFQSSRSAQTAEERQRFQQALMRDRTVGIAVKNAKLVQHELLSPGDVVVA